MIRYLLLADVALICVLDIVMYVMAPLDPSTAFAILVTVIALGIPLVVFAFWWTRTWAVRDYRRILRKQERALRD